MDVLPATKRYLKATVGWCAFYLALATLPLGLALLDAPDERRSFWVEFSIGLGFVGFALLILQFALTARFRDVGRPFGIDTLLQFHRQAGLVAFGFVLAHPVIAFLSDPAYLGFLDPRVNLPRAAALTFVILAVTAIIVTTLWRTTFGLSYEWWRVVHGVLALLVVFIGLAHGLQVGHYLEPLWKQVFWILMTGLAVALLVHARIVKPLRMRRRPWRIVDVRPERDSSWTLALEPVGHPGFRFTAGQYAWLTVHDTPFTLQQHPFSFSCSETCAPERVEFTIKEFGDFTSKVKDFAPETRAYLEGPYGAFSLESAAPGAVFLAGGIGITPIMSMLRTARDRNDQRPFVLFYGNPDFENVTFREELDAMSSHINLKLVYVIEHPPEGWQGEKGLLNRELIDRHVDDQHKRAFPFFICGPPIMMDVAEQSLRKIGVPLSHIRSERFDIV